MISYFAKDSINSRAQITKQEASLPCLQILGPMQGGGVGWGGMEGEAILQTPTGSSSDESWCPAHAERKPCQHGRRSRWPGGAETSCRVQHL